ncbi:lipocalin family protein [Marinobacter salexigens]|uniref:Outer membrane lipoprotein Blc n=1 Tax=Marinobacter salexigens TaxID=1925763 RepID=A0ABS6A6X7_9GAMM|nr:lipocalin family protein [Marinobacter salexigens]MBU2873942.1 lipocalin family protein [Marinobacter salexigens]
MIFFRNPVSLCFTLSCMLMLAGCTGVPKGIEPVTGLNADRYLGKWYEIARLDHSFEEGLSRVTAEYELQDDGSIKVTNRGYDAEVGEWSIAEGRAVFVDSESAGHLKVSFFGPFYASYVIFELDTDEYQYAFITGYNRDYLWFLSRTPDVSDEEIARFKKVAQRAGFELEALVIVDHSPVN